MASKPPSRLFAMVLVMLVALSLAISSVGHDVHSTNEGREYEEVKDKAKRAQDKAAETAQENKEASESWAEWAKEKLSEGFGLRHDDDDGSKGATREASGTGQYSADKVKEVKDAAAEKAREVKNAATEKAGDITNAAKEKVCEAANAAKEKASKIKNLATERSVERTNEETERASQKVEEAKEKVSQAAREAAEKASEAKQRAAQKAGETKEKASKKAEEAKGATTEMGSGDVEEARKRQAEAEEQLSWAKEKAKEVYEKAKSKAGETLEAAKHKFCRLSYKRVFFFFFLMCACNSCRLEKVTLFLKKQGLSNAVAARTINKSDLFIDHLVSRLHSIHKSQYLVGCEHTTLEIRDALIPYLEALLEEHGDLIVDVAENFPDPPVKRESTWVNSSAQSNLDSRKLKARSRVSEIDPAAKLRPNVLYLIELGMGLEQIKGIIQRFSAFAYYSSEGKMKPLVEFLLDLGVAKSDILAILNRRPQLCGMHESLWKSYTQHGILREFGRGQETKGKSDMSLSRASHL
ncbi:hypothetical protein FH972_015733 [Carpinus fangiana]|uniref:FRIGIDA-like protein n=1 Tax=Carpinus fangiana TaxID=176857 RepID=A0A5N6RE93_9ROSI|nr:hypothetical protein FH972_015733 [Carpinus fangiana]